MKLQFKREAGWLKLQLCGLTTYVTWMCRRHVCSAAVAAVLSLLNTGLAFADSEFNSGSSLKGGVEVREELELLGVWNFDVKRLPKRRTVVINQIENYDVQGTYTGLLGTFPLTGKYDAATGNVYLSVDFSHSKLAKLRFLGHKSLVGQLQGKIEGGRLKGVASMPDVTNRTFNWEATKAVQ